MLIQPTVNVALRSKLLSTFFRPAHTWRQYANSFGQKTLKWAPSSGASCRTTAGGGLPSSHRSEDLAWSSHRTQKKKKKKKKRPAAMVRPGNNSVQRQRPAAMARPSTTVGRDSALQQWPGPQQQQVETAPCSNGPALNNNSVQRQEDPNHHLASTYWSLWAKKTSEETRSC